MNFNNEYSDFDRNWIDLKPTFQKIFTNFICLFENKELSTKFLTRTEYSAVYSKIYNMGIAKEQNHSEQLYAKFDEVILEYYKIFKIDEILNIDNEILENLKKLWENHEKFLKLICNLFQYIDRSYVVHYNVHSLKKKGMLFFRKEILNDENKMKAIGNYIKLLDYDREEMQIDRILLKEITNIFIKINDDDGNPLIYKELEYHIIHSSVNYYIKMANNWMKNCNCAEYLQNTYKLLKKEEERLEACISTKYETKNKVMSEFDKYLIVNYKQYLMTEPNGIYFMLENNQKEILTILYTLYIRLNDSFEGIRQKFKDFIVEKGIKLVEVKTLQLEELENIDKIKYFNDSNEPNFILDFIKLNDDFLFILENCFQNNSYFMLFYREALAIILNQEIGPFSFAEYLAKFSDKILKKKLKNKDLSDVEIELYLEKIILLFGNLTEKDLFISIYKNYFAERLLMEKIDNESEKAMISKIKTNCGTQYTKELEGMIQDIHSSKDINSNFSDFILKNKFVMNKIEFSIKILSKANWPSDKFPSFNIPPSLLVWKEQFIEFYNNLSKTNHILEWAYHMSSITMIIYFNKKNHDVTMSMFQAQIIFLFDKKKQLSFKEILDKTEYDQELLIKILKSMLANQVKFLLKIKTDHVNNSEFSLNDEFAFNFDLIPKQRKFALPTINARERINKEKVIENREMAVEAAIVRVMKSRKKLEFSTLVEEVGKILYQFSASKHLIKSKIDQLIGKDYIERDSKNIHLIKYLA